MRHLAIVLAATPLSSALARNCADADIPVVLFNRVMAQGSAGTVSSVSSVRSDNVAGGRAVADFLVRGGHRRMAYIAGNEESSTNLERERGFREGLAVRGLHIWARATGNYDFEQARQATLEIFAPGRDLPDAVFVASDHMAFAVMDTLRFDLRLEVPQAVSVVGFDNVPQAHWGSDRLTTFEQPVAPMIEATVNLLQATLRDDDSKPEARNVVVPGKLIVRESARLPIETPVHAALNRRPAWKVLTPSSAVSTTASASSPTASGKGARSTTSHAASSALAIISSTVSQTITSPHSSQTAGAWPRPRTCGPAPPACRPA